jgi:hypothetical protein
MYIETVMVKFIGSAYQFDSTHVLKFTLEQAKKAQRGSRGIDLLFL